MFVSDVIQSLLDWAVTVHMIHDIQGYRQITYWSSTEQFRMPCLQWHLVKFPCWCGGESYADRAGPLENLPCSGAWSCVATTGGCLVLSNGAHRTRNSDKLRCHMFCSWGWVTVVATSLLMLCLQ